MSEELKPCPFCGSNGCKYFDNYRQDVLCPECGLIENIWDNWNTRPIEDALRAELAELRQANRWISVEERLPEDSVDVLVVADKVYWSTRIAHHKDLAEAWYYEHDGREVYHVTHWRPLPAPPVQS